MKVTFLTPTPAKLVSFYIVVTVIIFSFGIISYIQRKEETKAITNSELLTITEHKAKSAEYWRAERIGDAGVIMNSAGFIESFLNYMKDTGRIKDKKIIENRLESYRKYFLYQSVYLLDKNLNLKFTTDKGKIEAGAIENLKKSFSEESPVLSNLMFSELDSSIFLDIASPLYDDKNLVGGIILRTNPNDFLFPEINSWPVETETAETGLISVIGNEVVFLNNFRSKENSSLRFKFAIDSSTKHLTAVRAAMGLRGLAEGVDYRGKATLNYIRGVAGSDWILISKIDRDEVLAPLYKSALIQLFITIIFLSLFGFMLFWIWSNRKKALLIQKLEEETVRRAIERNYEYFVKYANDVIILSDENLDIHDVNERAEKFYGYTREEMLKMNIKDLVITGSQMILDNNREEEAKLRGGVIYETEHKTKNGKLIPVETSLNRIEVEGRNFYQRIIRDISERKEAEDKFFEEYNLRSAIEESMSSGIAVVDNKGRQTIVNTAFANMVGWSKEELIGRTAPFLYWPEEELENINRMFQLTVQGKAPKNGFEMIFRRKSGERFYVHFNISELKNTIGEIIGWLAVVNDISWRKAAEKKMLEDYNFKKAVEDSMTVGIIASDLEGRLNYVNPAFANMVGWSQEELNGKTAPFLYWPEEEYENIFNLFNTVLQGKNLESGYEMIFKRKSGERFYVHLDISRMENAVGDSIGWLALVTDISLRKAVELKLNEEYSFRRAIEESMSSGIVASDLEGRTTYVNPAFANMVGWSREELTGKTAPFLYWPEEEYENIYNFFGTALQGEKPEGGFEMIFKRKSGERFYVQFAVSKINNANGTQIGWLAVVNDISEKKTTELKLNEEYNFRRAVEESMSSGIIASDLEGRLNYVNPAFINMVGFSREELIGKTAPFAYYPEEEYENITHAFRNSGGGNNPEGGFELIFKRKSGERFYVQLVVSRIKNRDGGHIGWLGVVNDISEKKAAEEKLRESDRKTKALINATNDAVLMIDLNGTVLAANDEMARSYGHEKTRDELIGLNALDFLTPEEKKRRGAFMEAVIKEGKHKRFTEFDEITGVVYEHSLYPIFDDRGSVKSIAIYFRDITQSTNAAEELRKSEEKYRSIFENIQDVFHQINASGIVTEISPSVINLLGYKREEIVGRHISEFYNSLPEAQAFRDAMLNKGSVEDYEFSLKDKTGNPVPISVSARLIRDSEGNLTGAEGIFRNVAERKRYEDTLKDSERRYRTLVETMHDGIMQVDNNDTILFVNDSTCRIFGYSREELLGKNSADTIIHPDDRNIVVTKNKLREKGYSDSYEIRGINKHGGLIWLNISGAPVHDNDGNVTGSVGFIIDVTERKKSEAEILKISQAVNQSPIMIIITDCYGRIEYINPKVTEVTGYTHTELIGKNPRLFKSGFTKEEEYKNLWDTIKSGNEWSGDFYNKKKNGECYWERTSISSVKDYNGVITHFIAVKEDITVAKQKELELIAAKEKAEESERIKSSFLANMSHELRTPMVGILGFSELLKESVTGEEQLEFAETIFKSGKRLMETLNLILDLSRIEAGKLDVVRRDLNIVPLIKESYNNFVAASKVKNLEMGFSASSEEIIAFVDEKLLFESVNNLINNAIKYTNEGRIDVELETAARESGEVAVIRVIDTGIGVPKESMNLIFEEFRQASEGYGRTFEGTGLGLTITKNFIEKSGGKIYVESDENKGSVFTIEVPLSQSQKQHETEGGKTESRTEIIHAGGENERLRVLCIEDEDATRFLVKQLLKNNYELAFAGNGEKALELAKAGSFDIVLMDVNLGKGMNGVDVTKQLRSISGYSDVRIIAMTAYAMKGDKERFIKAGMDNYISKPFGKNELISVLNEEILAIKNRN